MSLFSKTSAFDSSDFHTPVGPKKPVPKVIKPPDTTEVPAIVLERWYAALNDLITNPPLRTSAHREGFEELRDEIYSYLRG